MDHPQTAAGKALKYARVERERRFLLAGVPGGPCIRRAEIVDRYLSGTRIRLRRAVETTATGSTTSRKLTQKIPAPDGGPGLITSLYLDEPEFRAFEGLARVTLAKTRYRVPPLGIDVFGGVLGGLVVAEVEFETPQEEKAFRQPTHTRAEVTLDARLTGGRLARTTRGELLDLLAAYDADPVDTSELARRPLSPG